jgi:hypothetical protein
MRRFSNSSAFARMRLVNGAIFIALGGVIAVRTIVESGPPVTKVTSFVLAGAMAALGAFRLRSYFQLRAQER